MNPVAQLTLQPWIEENIGVQNGIIEPSLVSSRQGEQARMTFPVDSCTDGLREGVIGFVKKS